jgi:hypothetical protein
MNIDWNVEVIVAAAAVVVSLIGLYFANNYRLQARIQLAEARRAAYAKLWEITGLATPSRLDIAGWKGVLTEAERARLFHAMTVWYYQDGNGMLLDTATRNVYLGVKHNLTCVDTELRPPEILNALPPEMTVEDRRGCLAIRQLSLLRSQMKTDLAIYGRPYVGTLTLHERLFLINHGIELERQPWRAASTGPAKSEQCDGPPKDRGTPDTHARSGAAQTTRAT